MIVLGSSLPAVSSHPSMLTPAKARMPQRDPLGPSLSDLDGLLTGKTLLYHERGFALLGKPHKDMQHSQTMDMTKIYVLYRIGDTVSAHIHTISW